MGYERQNQIAIKRPQQYQKNYCLSIEYKSFFMLHALTYYFCIFLFPCSPVSDNRWFLYQLVINNFLHINFLSSIIIKNKDQCLKICINITQVFLHFEFTKWQNRGKKSDKKPTFLANEEFLAVLGHFGSRNFTTWKCYTQNSVLALLL